MNWTLFIFGAILSGILYHIGGCGNDGIKTYPWLPKVLFGRINSKIRDWGCSIISLLFVSPHGLSWQAVGAYISIFLLSWGALSTYWKKGADCKWYHWLLHGVAIGLAFLPATFIDLSLILIFSRAIILGVLMMWISQKTKNVAIEEIGRGALIILTEIIFLVGLFRA